MKTKEHKMNSVRVRAWYALGTLIVICLLGGRAAAQSATPRIVGAANAFLSSLDEKQRKSVLFAFDDEEQRARWSNLPTSFVRLAALELGDLSAPQRLRCFPRLSAEGLSKKSRRLWRATRR